MTSTDLRLTQTGNWGENVMWELYDTATLPPEELCTAVMCVAIADDKVVLACSKRGWGMLGGHIEVGESFEETLRREALEEGGFIVEQYRLFAVRKIMAKVEMPHQRQGESYPFPTSYMLYYWATTTQPLKAPTGEEIIESRSFNLSDVNLLRTPDQQVIKAGWKAFMSHSSSSR